MSAHTYCNWRAGIFLIVLPAVLLVLVAPALGVGYWYDGTGVAADSLGHAITGLPDINGDGYDEFLAGVPGYDPSGTDAGRVFLWYGGSGAAGAEVTVAPDSIFTGTSPEQFGWAIASIGDVNNDGLADWAVGAPYSNVAGALSGRVYVYYGGNPATAPARDVIDGARGGDRFGFSIAAAGDFNGDGRDDFIVGAPFALTGNGLSGAAYVIYGKNGGPSTDLADATVLSGEIAGDDFGWSVCGAGNFLGGATDCVAVGAPLADGHGGTDAGAVFVYAGGGTPDAVADFVAGSSAAAAPFSRFGFEVCGAGRLDGDTNDDLAVGAPYSNAAASAAGRVEIFYGGTIPSGSAGHFINGNVAGDHFGWSLAAVGQLVGSSRGDLVVGAPGYLTDAGRAYIYEAGSSSTTASSLVAVANVGADPGSEANDAFGWDVAAAGDLDGDGLADYAVAAPGGNNGGSNAESGFVMLVHSSIGPVANLLSDWRAEWQGSGLVEIRFALSEPADDIVRVELTRLLSDSHGVQRGQDVVWSGPARAASDGSADVLFRRGDGFGFLDDLSGGIATDLAVSYRLVAETIAGTSIRLDALAGPGTPTVTAPSRLALSPAWPNPANPAVNIRFRAAEGVLATVRILDVRGRAVRELHAAPGSGAWQTVVWDGLTESGRSAASGIYLIRLEAAGQLRTERVTLAR